MKVDQQPATFKIHAKRRKRLSEFSTEPFLNDLVCLGLDVEIIIHKDSIPFKREAREGYSSNNLRKASSRVSQRRSSSAMKILA